MNHSFTRLLLTILVVQVSALMGVIAQTPIAISEARKQAFQSTVSRVAGRVTAADEFRNTSYIQDKTAGIAIFNTNFRLGVTVGDSVVIDSAQLTEFQPTTGAPGTGSTQLSGSNFRFTVIPGPRIEPTPRTTTIPLVGESFEGQLIRIRRVTFVESGAFQGETTYSIKDALGNDLAVRLDGGTEIAVNSLNIPTGEIDIIGLISQFRGGYQIIPRYSTDVGLPPVEVDTVAKSNTLDVTTWNLEWYGSTDTTKGPSDKNRQRTSIRRVIDSVQADIFCFQEVTTEEALVALTDSIKGTYATLYNNDIPSEQKMAFIYNVSTITPVSSGLAVNGGSQAWANGRFPFRFTFDATINGVSRRMVVFNIHAKATDSATATVDYGRRRVDAETFHAYLRDFYNDSAVIFTGDFNDILTASIVDSTFASPYKAFLDDAAQWSPLTLPLEERGLASYIGFNRSFLDHLFVSRHLKNSIYRTYLEAPNAYLSSYTATVSDHLPVTTRVYLNAVTSVSGTEILSSNNIRLAPNPASNSATLELILNVPGLVNVILIDAIGSTIELLNITTTHPEIRIVRIPVELLNSGTYSVVSNSPEGLSRVPLVITK